MIGQRGGGLVDLERSKMLGKGSIGKKQFVGVQGDEIEVQVGGIRFVNKERYMFYLNI